MWISLTQIILKNLRENFNLYKRIFIIILIILFFLGNKEICDYFYPYDDEDSVELWWILKLDIYAIIIALCFIVASLKNTSEVRIAKIEKFISNVGIGLAVSNAIDRHTGNRDYFTLKDLATIIAVLLVSYYDFKRLDKIAKTHSGYNE